MNHKFFILCLAILSCICCTGFAEFNEELLESMSVDQLLELRIQINQMLENKGYAVYTDISHGDKGENVIMLQEKLTELGYYHGKISGKYDTETEKAVKRFQKDNGLDISGTATQSFQKILYSENAVPSDTAKPTPTSTPEPNNDTVYDEYITLNYDDCARYPEKYNGTKVKLIGRALQVMGSKEKGFEVRLASSGYDNVYCVKINKNVVDFNILEGDHLTIYATLSGVKTYISTFLKLITIPYAKADFVVLR